MCEAAEECSYIMFEVAVESNICKNSAGLVKVVSSGPNVYAVNAAVVTPSVIG